VVNLLGKDEAKVGKRKVNTNVGEKERERSSLYYKGLGPIQRDENVLMVKKGIRVSVEIGNGKMFRGKRYAFDARKTVIHIIGSSKEGGKGVKRTSLTLLKRKKS